MKVRHTKLKKQPIITYALSITIIQLLSLLLLSFLLVFLVKFAGIFSCKYYHIYLQSLVTCRSIVYIYFFQIIWGAAWFFFHSLYEAISHSSRYCSQGRTSCENILFRKVFASRNTFFVENNFGNDLFGMCDFPILAFQKWLLFKARITLLTL